jgi:fluoride exporter
MTRHDLLLASYIAAGGALGSATRYLLGTAIQERTPSSFPVGTLVINISGSLLLGFLARYAFGGASVSPEIRLFLTTGFCGGYTTFSAFSYETVRLFEEGDQGRALLYVALSVVLSIAATWLGFSLARALLGTREVV